MSVDRGNNARARTNSISHVSDIIGSNSIASAGTGTAQLCSSSSTSSSSSSNTIISNDLSRSRPPSLDLSELKKRSFEDVRGYSTRPGDLSPANGLPLGISPAAEPPTEIKQARKRKANAKSTDSPARV